VTHRSFIGNVGNQADGAANLRLDHFDAAVAVERRHRAPRRTNRAAMARPMPEAAPVTTIRRPVRSAASSMKPAFRSASSANHHIVP
jgi:hypothetical protein